MDYRQTVREKALRIGVDPNIAEALMIQESGGNPSVRSSVGAIGLMQLMPNTAKELGVDPHDPQQNIEGGLRYLKTHIDKHGLAGGLAAYNAGPGRVDKTADFSQLPAETQKYVPSIMERAAKMAQAPSTSSAQPQQLHLGRLTVALEKAKAANDAPAVEEISGLLMHLHQSALQKAQAASDEAAVNEIQGHLSALAGEPQVTQASPGIEKSTVEAPVDLAKVGRTLYKAYHGKEFDGHDAAAVDWAKEFASDFRWNTGTMAKVATTSGSWSPEQKQAFLDLQKQYDKEDSFSGDTLKRVAGSVLTDPLTYLTLGSGKLVARGGQAATELAVRNALEKSLAKRVITSTAGKAAMEGAAIGAGQNALTQTAEVNTDGKDSFSTGELAASAGIGGAAGGAVGKIVDKLTGISAVKNLVRNAGSEEGAKIDSEVIQRLHAISDNPNFRGQPVRAEQLNAVTKGFVEEADDAIRSLGAKEVAEQGGDAKVLRGALQNWKILTADDIAGLRGNPLGDSVADSIGKAQRTRSLTAEQEATSGMAKLGRSVLDVAPLPAPIRYGARAVIGGAQSRKQVTAELLRPGNMKAANRLVNDLGPSMAAGAEERLAALTQRSTQAKMVQEAVQAAQQAAKEEAAASVRHRVLQGTGRPLSGAFNELLQGGRSNLNMTSQQAIDGLRLASRQLRNNPVGEAAKAILKSGNVENQDAFYGLQNHLRALQERGVLAYQSPGLGALSAAFTDDAAVKVRNPAAYQAATIMRQKVYAKAEAETAVLPKHVQSTAKKAIHELSTGSPKNAEAVLAKVNNHLASLTPGEKSAVQEILSRAMLFYTR